MPARISCAASSSVSSKAVTQPAFGNTMPSATARQRLQHKRINTGTASATLHEEIATQQETASTCVRPVAVCSTDIEPSEYLSGQPHATLIGRIVSLILPPPLRFLSCWVAPLTCLISLYAPAVVALAGTAVQVAQVCKTTAHVLAQCNARQHASTFLRACDRCCNVLR